MSSSRRKFLSTSLGAGVAGVALAAPAIVKAQTAQTFSWKMTSAYPKGSPFYMDGPGSATDLAKRIFGNVEWAFEDSGLWCWRVDTSV